MFCVFLNKLISVMTKKEYSTLLLGGAIIFSVWTTIIYFSEGALIGGGTGILWMIYLYLVGAYFNTHQVNEKVLLKFAWIISVLSLIGLVAYQILSEKLVFLSRFDIFGNNSLLPLLFSLSVFIIFKIRGRFLYPKSGFFYNFRTWQMDCKYCRKIGLFLCEDLKYPLKNIKRVLFVGEPMNVKQLNIWVKALPWADFVNLYGSTENAGNCLYHIIKEEIQEDRVPIGKPFANVDVFLLDDEDKPVKQTDTESLGEICLIGNTLALGYYKIKIKLL